jgi:hypothetical protein
LSSRRRRRRGCSRCRSNVDWGSTWDDRDGGGECGRGGKRGSGEGGRGGIDRLGQASLVEGALALGGSGDGDRDVSIYFGMAKTAMCMVVNVVGDVRGSKSRSRESQREEREVL